MCLIAIAWRAHPDYPLIVAANRDEWRARPTAAACWWTDAPHILAGRDLEAGGTWLGVTRGGRFAALTNFRDPSDKKPGAPSRGELVRAFLDSTESPPDFLAALRPRASRYAGFNLLAGDGEALFCFSARTGDILPVPPGIHALSNHSLDEPWPKVERARSMLEVALGPLSTQAQHASLDISRLFDLLSDAHHPPDNVLPDTGVGIEWERALSPILITGAQYGTRSSTVVAFHATGRIRFIERSRDADGVPAETCDEAFDRA
ncbi:MAG: NRDE family protein [Betaproteobacteria bacterium]|nr:NRDE family protein [Betaproteobacteria bacterium]